VTTSRVLASTYCLTFDRQPGGMGGQVRSSELAAYVLQVRRLAAVTGTDPVVRLHFNTLEVDVPPGHPVELQGSPRRRRWWRLWL
jgi:hypothetical protein